MENSEYRPIPGQTPLTLPPKQETAPTTLPSLPAELPADPAPAPVAAKPATNPPIIKTVKPKFVSPMPDLKETNNDIPSFLPVVAGIAAAVTIAFSILIYLKR